MIAIISDIHGNYVALEEVLKTIDKMDISEIYCLGDIVGYYPQVNECCDELRKRKVKCIMGNHDWYMVAKSFCPRSKSVNDCLAYQRKIITNENLNWIETFPSHRFEKNISMVHGGWTNPIDEYLDPNEEYFNKLDGKYFISGHSHIQSLNIFENKIYCNPGSVGQPRDENPAAAFATFNGENFELQRVAYNVDKIGELMELAGFNGYYYGCLKTGSKNLRWAEKHP